METYAARLRNCSQLYLIIPGAIACAPVAIVPAPAPSVNTAEQAMAPDNAADSLLVELITLDPTFVIEMRYATANNFAGAKLRFDWVIR